ncbi:hypothetical protein Godav_023822 [Gossypium davidsonii]|uniref:Uncharacterized protein n=1 Tax=Gossypium davidsonii TaxID=34287 RepID=A0A7J8SUM4_GOSDV|nr:hypothetical protein [Gossypium davidsonii]
MNPDPFFILSRMKKPSDMCVHPQNIKKKHSIEIKAKDSKTVTKVHSTSSTMEISSHLQPPVKYDKLKSGHRKIDVGRVNWKASRRKTDGGNHMGHMICLRFSCRQRGLSS